MPPIDLCAVMRPPRGGVTPPGCRQAGSRSHQVNSSGRCSHQGSGRAAVQRGAAAAMGCPSSRQSNCGASSTAGRRRLAGLSSAVRLRSQREAGPSAALTTTRARCDSSGLSISSGMSRPNGLDVEHATRSATRYRTKSQTPQNKSRRAGLPSRSRRRAATHWGYCLPQRASACA